MHVHRSVSGACKPIANTKVGFLGSSIESRKLDDLFYRQAGDFSGPGRRAICQMGAEFGWPVRVLLHIGPVRHVLLEQHMHHCAGQRTIGTWLEHQVQISLVSCFGPVGINHNKLCAIKPACLGRMVHDIDLGTDRVAPPHHHQITLFNQARVATALDTGTGNESSIGQGHTIGGMLARGTIGVAKPIQPVTLYMPHCSRIMKGPDGFCTRVLFNRFKPLTHSIQRLFPTDRNKVVRASRATFGNHAFERGHQPVGMVHTFCVSGYLGADNSLGIAVILGAVYTANGTLVQHFYIQCTDTGTIMRTNATLTSNHVSLSYQRQVYLAPVTSTTVRTPSPPPH